MFSIYDEDSPSNLKAKRNKSFKKFKNFCKKCIKDFDKLSKEQREIFYLENFYFYRKSLNICKELEEYQNSSEDAKIQILKNEFEKHTQKI